MTPERPAWMRPAAAVPADAAWCGTLREAPVSWIDADGVSERFRYLDGVVPSEAPFRASCEGRALRFHPSGFSVSHEPPEPGVPGALLVETGVGGPAGGSRAAPVVLAARVPLGHVEHVERVDLDRLTFAADAAAALRALVERHGLAPAESASPLALHRAALLDRPGRRLLYVLRQEEHGRRAFPPPVEVRARSRGAATVVSIAILAYELPTDRPVLGR